MKKKVSIFIFIVVFLLCNSYCPVLAQDEITNILTNTFVTDTNTINSSSLNQLQIMQNETQVQVDQTNEQLEGVKSELSETMQQIQNLNEKIEGYEIEIETLEKEANRLKNSITELENKLLVSTKTYEEKKESLLTRLKVLYEVGQTTYLDVLLQSNSIADFISRYYLISQIAAYDDELLEEAELNKIEIEVAKSTLEEQRKQYKVAKDNAEKTAIILENTRVIKNNYINKLSNDEKELQEKIDIYNQQIKEIEAEILLRTQATIGENYAGGSFAWPVPGYTRISSPFGMRVHPITKVYKLHTGTDIAAPMGTNFIAMNDGTVIKAGWNTAYGNMVIIDHGGGVVTLYAHGLDILVSMGQTVKKGDPILKVGNTGYSTGPHAHFEVRINGEYIDPMKFFSQNEQGEEKNEEN